MYEHILNNIEENAEDKIVALLATWSDLLSLNTKVSEKNIQSLLQFLTKHTLNIVLSAIWTKYTDKFCDNLASLITQCSEKFRCYHGITLLCQRLAILAKSPWQNPMMIRILNTTDPKITLEEYNFFVREESGYFISMRLQKLCENRCEDMAMNLTRMYIKCWEWADTSNRPMRITVDQRKFILDVYVALLFNQKRTPEMTKLLKTVSLTEGVELVQRFTTKVVSASNIWQHSISVAQLASVLFLTRGILEPFEKVSECLTKLLDVWLKTYVVRNNTAELQKNLRKILTAAISSPHMYLVCDQLYQKFGAKMRTYTVEVCIQAINTDLNLLEKLRNEDESDQNKVLLKRVAEGYLKLAKLLEENVNVARECVLSSFSLEPTLSSLKEIERMARLSGYEVLDTGQWICKFHPPPEDDDVLIMCDECKGFMTQLRINRALKMPNIALTEALNANSMGLSEQLRDDLVVILFCNRYQMLSWLQNWTDLHRLCAMYLDDPVRTKNNVTALKFLVVDYTPFLLKRKMESEEELLARVELKNELVKRVRNSTRKRRRSLHLSSSDTDSADETAAISLNYPDVVRDFQNFRKFSGAHIEKRYECNKYTQNKTNLLECKVVLDLLENDSISKAHIEACDSKTIKSNARNVVNNRQIPDMSDDEKLYNLQQCRVVLDRINIPSRKLLPFLKRSRGLNHRNTVQIHRKMENSFNTKDTRVENFNLYCHIPLQTSNRPALSTNNKNGAVKDKTEQVGTERVMNPTVVLHRLEDELTISFQ